MADMKMYRKPLSLKDNERHENKNIETVKVQIHQMDHFVLYKTVCCFASDQQPQKLETSHNTVTLVSVTIHHVMSHLYVCTHTFGPLSLNEFEYINLKYLHQVSI